jgi:hypothetical protein
MAQRGQARDIEALNVATYIAGRATGGREGLHGAKRRRPRYIVTTVTSIVVADRGNASADIALVVKFIITIANAIAIVI